MFQKSSDGRVWEVITEDQFIEELESFYNDLEGLYINILSLVYDCKDGAQIITANFRYKYVVTK